MELATITLNRKELEHGEPVGIVSMTSGMHTLYENHDKGLSYYIGEKEICFMDMLDEDNYDKVINEISKMLFTSEKNSFSSNDLKAKRFIPLLNFKKMG